MTILLCDVLRVLQCLGKHFLLIKVMVEPESSKTFSNLLDLTAAIISITIIVIGARLVLLVRRSARDDKSRAIFVVGLVISLLTDTFGLDVAR